MKRNAGIIAYGTEEDRQKLSLLAEAHGLSNSELVIKMIREKYENIFGEKHENLQDHLSGRHVD